MPFWSDIEPYIDYWLEVNVNRYEESEPYRLGARRSRRHRSDDPPVVSPTLANPAAQPVERSVLHSHRLQLEESAATSEDMPSTATADFMDTHTAPARPYRTPNITTSADNHEEIEELKVRYIVGRKAGKDITRPNGKLIVGKGEVITRRMIAQAEEAGKLVELILNMVLEDFDG